MLSKEQANKLPKYTPNPLLKDLPEYLKDPKNYYKVQKKLLNTLAGQHSHSEMMNWANCITCQNKMVNLREAVLKLGFKSSAQYLGWKKTIEHMINPRSVKIR